MTAYENMIKINHNLIKGIKLTDIQKSDIVNLFLIERSSSEQAQRFYDRVKYYNNFDNNGRRMYPVFYIPPYNEGNKLKTIFDQTPKTHILSANMYELEILRLLYKFAPKNEIVENMIYETLKRLKTTCFGYCDDGIGECFDTSLIVLRFIGTVAPQEKKLIQERINNYNNHRNEKKRPSFAIWYFWLCLSEIPYDIAKPEIEKYKNEMINWLYNKSFVMNSEHDKTIHPVLMSMLRNIIAKYSEYEYIKDRLPYVSEKDGRLYLDMQH